MIHTNNMKHYRGFIALIAIMTLALGTFAFSIGTMSVAMSYRDAVYAREIRIQKRLDQQACLDAFELMKAKDYFFVGDSNCGKM